MNKSILAIILLSVISAFGCQQISGQQLKQYDPKRKMSKTPAEWKKILTPNQYYIMVESGTEPPFNNPYDHNTEKGVYVSAATGEVLFSSEDKFDSGTGWPSFVKPVDPKKIEIVRDNSDGMVRDEVIERSTGLHLGHVFDDGPADRGGKRYCMNSGALKFIKK
jgi:peptide-methionine (R)-S-oxide reductase/peptide methionine sulfoxide reductase msrA/msrB